MMQDQTTRSLPELVTPHTATQGVIDVIQKASTENDDIHQFMTGPVRRGEKTMKHITNSLQNLSDTFRELNFYKGKILEKMYEETLVTEQAYKKEQDKVVKTWKNVPLMKPFEMKQNMLRAKKNTRIKKALLDTSCLKLENSPTKKIRLRLDKPSLRSKAEE
jgi:hypothetical protein